MHLSQAKATPVKQCRLFFQQGSRNHPECHKSGFLHSVLQCSWKKCVKATLCLSEGSLVYKAFLSKSVIIYTYWIACLRHSIQDTFVLQNKITHAMLCHLKSRAYLDHSSHLGGFQWTVKGNSCTMTSRKSLLWVISLWIHGSWNQRTFQNNLFSSLSTN